MESPGRHIGADAAVKKGPERQLRSHSSQDHQEPVRQ